MKAFKNLCILFLLIGCLAFVGCTSDEEVPIEDTKSDEIVVTEQEDKTEEKVEEKTEENEPSDVEAEKTEDEQPGESKKYADDPAAAALKAHAKSLKKLYASEFNVVFDDVRFMFADFSNDGQSELLAVGVHEDDFSYMEIYDYRDGKISKIFEGQCGAANGINIHPVRYDGAAYVMKESISSAMGFYQQLMHYDGTDWYTVHSSFIDFDFYNNGEKKGCYVNDAPASDEEYDNVRKEVEEGRLNHRVVESDFDPFN